MTMQSKRVFISTSTFGEYTQEPILKLRGAGFDVDLNPFGRQLTEVEIREFLREKQVIGLIAGTEPLTQDVIYSARNLKVISRCGIGIDNIDIEALKERRIKLYRTPNSPALAVAELTLGLMLDSLSMRSMLLAHGIFFNPFVLRRSRIPSTPMCTLVLLSAFSASSSLLAIMIS